ncbi:MAG: helix-turn-helix transcriptional regulator [Deltaproteobacteria bacterium]|nr:helix-turn-helix transcriptional regulator [Deltaproteobacteria bacterium]
MARTIPPDRLAHLVHCATDVFIAQGYQRTQMADIAAALGVAKGTLYLYVESLRSCPALCGRGAPLCTSSLASSSDPQARSDTPVRARAARGEPNLTGAGGGTDAPAGDGCAGGTDCDRSRTVRHSCTQSARHYAP